MKTETRTSEQAREGLLEKAVKVVGKAYRYSAHKINSMNHETVALSENELNMVSQKLIEGNRRLESGNTQGLEQGIASLRECLSYAYCSDYENELVQALNHLEAALDYQKVVEKDAKEGWAFEDGLSHIGLKGKCLRDEQLASAWEYISGLNNKLKKQDKAVAY